MKRYTLEEFVAPLSERLNRTEVPAEPSPYAEPARPERSTDGMTQKQLVDTFCQEAEKIRVSVIRTKPEHAAEEVKRIVADARRDDKTNGVEAQQGPAVYADDKRLIELGIHRALGVGAKKWDARKGREALLDACNNARFGVTYAASAIAETGTVVQPCDSKCGRSISLLPLAHIVLVDADSIVATMADSLKALAAGGDEGGSALPSQVCFISGPSVTSDIELVRVEGVHGPMYVYYLVLD